MEKPITDAIDNLEASIDEGGNWKTFERALELVCSQRVQNVWKAETSKHSATKRKPTCSLSLCLPDSGLLQNQTTSTRQSARLLSLVFQPSGHSVKGRSIMPRSQPRRVGLPARILVLARIHGGSGALGAERLLRGA